MHMRFCTGKNSVLILSALMCQIFLSYFLFWQTAISAPVATVSCADASGDCGLSLATGPTPIFLEDKKPNIASGKMASRIYQLISFFSKQHLIECAQTALSKPSKPVQEYSFWLIYCSIRR